MKKVIFWTTLTVFFIVLVQTAVFSHISFFKFQPELILLIIAFISISNGSMTGMICGFIAGLILDFLSLAPIGLNSFIFIVVGYAIGKFKGVYNLNKFLFPSFLGFIVFLVKVAFLFLLNILFGKNIHCYNVFDIDFLVQLGINSFLTPLVFFILNLFPSVFIAKEKAII